MTTRKTAPKKPAATARPAAAATPAPPPPGHRIIGIKAENIKALKLVDLDLRTMGNTIYVSGKNGAGKTSLLDAIWYALLGKNTIPKSGVLRKGTTKGVIEVEFEDFVVTRKFSESDKDEKGRLTIRDRNGRAPWDNPQTLLDRFLSAISFDPLEFMSMKPAEQLGTLQELNPEISDTIIALDQKHKQDTEERKAVNRELAGVETRIKAALKIDAGAIVDKKLRAEILETVPAEPIDVAALLGEVQAAGSANAARLHIIHQAETLEETAKSANLRAQSARQTAADLRAEAAEILREADEADQRAGVHDGEAVTAREQASTLTIPELVDTSDLDHRIRTAQATNERVELRRQMEAKLAESEAYTAGMLENRAERVRIIAEAKMPIEGLSYGEAEVIYNGIPFDNLSSAEKISVSVSLAMAANPKIRVMRIKDGSLLDTDSREYIERKAKEQNYQILVELVGVAPEGIVMEEGEVVRNA